MFTDAAMWSIVAFLFTWSAAATAAAIWYWRRQRDDMVQMLKDFGFALEQLLTQCEENDVLSSKLDTAKGIINKVQRRYARAKGRNAALRVKLRQEKSERKIWLGFCEQLAKELEAEKSARATVLAVQDLLRRLIEQFGK